MRWGQTKINYACCAGNNVRSRPKTSKQEIVFLAVAICPGQAGLGARGWMEGFHGLFFPSRALRARRKFAQLRNVGPKICKGA